MAGPRPENYRRCVQPPHHHLPVRAGRQAGQTSVEYLGMVLVIAAVVGVLFKAAPGFADQIIGILKKQIDVILGQ